MVFVLAVRSPDVFSPEVAGVLFENHWTYWIAILAAGAVLLLAGRTRADARLFKAGAAAVGIALLWTAAASLFTSPGERLYAVHVAMAEAAAKGDVKGILACTEQGFTINNLNIHANTVAEAAGEEIGSRLKQLGIRQTHFTDFHATVNSGGTATSRFVALTESDGGLIKSQWEISWHDQSGADWRMQDATLIKLGDQNISPGDVIK